MAMTHRRKEPLDWVFHNISVLGSTCYRNFQYAQSNLRLQNSNPPAISNLPEDCPSMFCHSAISRIAEMSWPFNLLSERTLPRISPAPGARRELEAGRDRWWSVPSLKVCAWNVRSSLLCPPSFWLESAARFLDLGFADNDGNHFLSSYVLERRTCKALFHILTFLSTAVSEILNSGEISFRDTGTASRKGRTCQLCLILSSIDDVVPSVWLHSL